MAEIKHEEKEKKGVFFTEEGGKRIAELLYFRSAPGRITVYHTEVDESLRGHGVGGRLVAAAVEYARANDLKIIATCPYAHKLMTRTPEFRDMLT